MKIANSDIALTSSHSSSETFVRKESLQVSVGGQTTTHKTNEQDLLQTHVSAQDRLNLSQEYKNTLQHLNTAHAKSTPQSTATQMSAITPQTQTSATTPDENTLYQISDKDKQKLQLLQQFYKSLTGKDLHIYLLDKIENTGTSSSPEMLLGLGHGKGTAQTFAPLPAAGSAPKGWGITYDRQESYHEAETLSFSAKGQIRTSDGKNISISVQLNMSREFATSSQISLRAGDAIDPLVINYDGKAAELTDTKFRFDLDTNGTNEQISFLKPGSGFLALDVNQDGKINDGRELFGPASGDGFADLSRYDGDNNHWIDENDPVFNKLRIWTKDENGHDQLFALGQKGIGAIYLGNVSAEFALKNLDNQQLGQSRQAGIFLKENGQAGTVQQVDLVV